MFHKQDMKSLISLNSSESLKLEACTPVIIWRAGFTQKQERWQALLCSTQRTGPSEPSANDTGTGTNSGLQEI